MDFIPWYVTILRLVVPISILRFPLWGIVASIFADGLDWNLIGIKSKEMDVVYQNWDKTIDIYAYLFILWIVLQWKDRWAKKVAVGLLVYRVVGQIIFLVTKWRMVFVFFPNVFENFVIVCLLIFWWTKKQGLNMNVWQKILMMMILIIPKTIQEYFQHVLVKQPWELYSLGTMMGVLKSPNANIDTYLWMAVLYVIPVSLFLLFLGKRQISTNKN